MTSTSAAGADETSPLLTVSAVAPVTAPTALAAPTDIERGTGEANGLLGDGVGNGDGEVAKPAVNMLLVFPAITMGVFLASADGTIALVSYATISSELDALNLASWIMTSYSLTLASCQPLYGKLCDIFGRKQCLQMAYVIFAAGCLGCSMAQSIEQLIAARVLQAMGGGGLGTVISIMLTDLVPSKDRGVWQGVVNIVWALGAGLGAPLGGLITGTVGWRWSFLGQVPLCAIAFTFVSLTINKKTGQGAGPDPQHTLQEKLQRIDFLGSAMLIVTIASLMFGLDRGSNVSWVATETWVSMIVSVVAGIVFFQVESKVAKEPVVPPEVSVSPRLLPIYLSSFLVFFAMVALEYLLPLYYQAKDGMTPQKASFYLLPAIIVSVTCAMSTGFWMRRTGQYYWALILASTFQSLGILIAFLCSGPAVQFTPGLMLGQVVTEMGVGNAVVSGLIAVIGNAETNSLAVVTAAFYAFRNLGSVLGVSVTSSVIQLALKTFLTVELQNFDLDIDEIVDSARRSLDSIETLNPEIAHIVRECYGKAITRGLLVILFVSTLALIPVTQIKGGKASKESSEE